MRRGKVFISISDAHKKDLTPIAREFVELGFELVATSGTAAVLARSQVSAMNNAAAPDDVNAAYQRQVVYGTTAYALLGLGAAGVGFHFAL